MSTDIIFIFKWWFVFFVIGITFLPITSKIFYNFIDRGYIFSKIIGLLLISYVAFILGSFQLLNFSTINLIFIWILLATPQLIIVRKDNLLKSLDYKYLFIEEILFFLCILIWAYIKGFNPDIHDLEKFMDFGFINSILRSDYFPPRDMWYTPLSINYYYFGHLFTAVVTKLSQIPSFITFNLMLSTIFAFTFAMSFSIGANLINNIRKTSFIKLSMIGLLFSFFVSLAGNLQTIYAFFSKYAAETPQPIWELSFSISTFPNSYWYPNATRFIYNTIHEFPSYSFVVADLHGHVLDIPVVLTMIAVFLMIFLSKKVKYSTIILLGFLLSIAYMTNAWDGLIYMGLGFFVFITYFFINSNGVIKSRIIEITVKLIKSSFVLFASFFIFSYVFNSNFDPFASGIGLNCSPSFLVNLEKVGPLLFENGFCQISPIWQLLILYGFFLFFVTSLLIFLKNKKLLSVDIFILLISVFSLLLIIAPEVIYLKDIYTGHFRANTMFKLTYQAYILLTIASVYAFYRIISELKTIRKKSYLTIFSYLIFILFAIPLIFLVAIYPYFAIPSGYKDLKTRSGLDGIEYLSTSRPDDLMTINWINENIEGQPVLLEAQGDSYTDYARISANTGLPTVLGWTVHEWLWRGSYDIPSARFPDITTLYETRNLEEAEEIIDKFEIKYVYVGGLENEKYKVYEDKFSVLGKIVFSSEESTLYEIN